MTTEVVVLPPRRQRAAAAFEGLRAAVPMPTMQPAPLPVPSPAEQIAGGLGVTVQAAIEKIVPYGAKGTLEVEADIDHRDAAGGSTRARLRVTYHAEGRQ